MTDEEKAIANERMLRKYGEVAYYEEEELLYKFGIKKNFMEKHAKELGCYTRDPRRFLRAKSDNHINKLASRERTTLKVRRKKQRA